jgi:hypothetical protein
LAVAAGVVAVAAAGVLLLRPSQGDLLVTAAGSKGQPAPAKVFVDGALRCQVTPCRLSGLASGMHMVRVESDGQVSADRAVIVTAGEAATHHVTLDGPPPPAGIRLAAEGVGLRVLIDGREVGSPPIALSDLEPGEHVMRLVSESDLYAPLEETFSLESGETRDFGRLRLPVRRGRLSVEAGEHAEGAVVRIDGKVAGEVPTVLELDPKREHEVTVSREGFNDRAYRVSFAPGEAETTLQVALDAAEPQGRARPRARHWRPTTKPAPRSAPGAGGAKINLNSIPVSRVILDGKLLGLTPVIGHSVSPGAHNAVFIHPDGTRKSVSVRVGAGERKTAAVKF